MLASNSKKENIGAISFILDDYRGENAYQGLMCSFDLYGETDEIDDLCPIEDYWYFCTRFASLMGFHEDTIAKYFGTM